MYLKNILCKICKKNYNIFNSFNNINSSLFFSFSHVKTGGNFMRKRDLLINVLKLFEELHCKEATEDDIAEIIINTENKIKANLKK